MVLFTFCFFSVLLFYIFRNQYRKELVIPFIFFVIFWTLILGSQYAVGTDYWSYLDIFKKNNFYNDKFFESKEYFFYYFLHFFWYFDIEGQSLFYVIYFIEVLLLIIFIKKTTSNDAIWIFILVFISFSTIFNNQMNAVRQYFSMYLFAVGLVYALNRKFVVSILFCLLSFGTHSYSILQFPIYLVFLLLSNYKISSKVLSFFLIAAFFISLLGFIDYVNLFMIESGFSHYVENEYVRDLSIKEKIIKYLFIVIYLFAINKCYINIKSFFAKRMFIIGIFSYGIRIACLTYSITNRFGMFFELIMLYPLVYYLYYLYRNRESILYVYVFLLFILYMIKVVILPSGEYLYNSILF